MLAIEVDRESNESPALQHNKMNAKQEKSKQNQNAGRWGGGAAAEGGGGVGSHTIETRGLGRSRYLGVAYCERSLGSKPPSLIIII